MINKKLFFSQLFSVITKCKNLIILALKEKKHLQQLEANQRLESDAIVCLLSPRMWLSRLESN